MIKLNKNVVFYLSVDVSEREQKTLSDMVDQCIQLLQVSNIFPTTSYLATHMVLIYRHFSI